MYTLQWSLYEGYMHVPCSNASSNFVQFVLFPVCVVDEDDDDDDESDVSQDSHE